MGSGIDRLLADTALARTLDGRRVGLLSNAASVTAAGVTVAAALAQALGRVAPRAAAGAAGGRSGGPGGGLVRLFAPEHGFAAGAGAGAAVADGHDPATGLPVHSLYGPRRSPADAALADLDVVVIDLRDVGVRCFTYAATAARLIEALGQAGVAALVCDRPNPLGGRRAGPRLEPAQRGFVAYLDVPFVHGRTLGALLRRHNEGLDTPADLSVVAPADDLADVEGPWRPPSPGLRDRETVLLYPGLVLLEGTNLSEGRGTEAPFRLAAAPWLDGPDLATAINAVTEATGVTATPVTVTPQSGKCAGARCHGVRFDRRGSAAVDGLALGVHLLAILRRHAAFRWIAAGPGAVPARADGPIFIDRLMGSTSLRLALDHGAAPAAILAEWDAALATA